MNLGRIVGLRMLFVFVPLTCVLFFTGWYTSNLFLTMTFIWMLSLAFGSLLVMVSNYPNLATPSAGAAAAGSLFLLIGDFHWGLLVHTLFWGGVFFGTFRFYFH